MKNILIIFCLAIGFLFVNCEQSDAQLFRDRPVAVGINWNAACAAESAVQFAIVGSLVAVGFRVQSVLVCVIGNAQVQTLKQTIGGFMFLGHRWLAEGY